MSTAPGSMDPRRRIQGFLAGQRCRGRSGFLGRRVYDLRMNPVWLGDIRAVLFDWGGTLCATASEMEVWPAAGRKAVEAARAAGLALDPEDVPSLIAFLRQARDQAQLDPQHREMDALGLLSDWLLRSGIQSPSFDALVAVADAFWSQWVGCLTPIGPVDGLLAGLRRGGYRLGLVSNTATPAKWCRAELDRLGLSGYFDGLTFSSEVGRRKPHAAIFEDALARVGGGQDLEASCVLFVGDSPACDVAGAARMGMRTALVRDGTATETTESAETARPDLIVRRATDLLAILTDRA